MNILQMSLLLTLNRFLYTGWYCIYSVHSSVLLFFFLSSAVPSNPIQKMKLTLKFRLTFQNIPGNIEMFKVNKRCTLCKLWTLFKVTNKDIIVAILSLFLWLTVNFEKKFCVYFSFFIIIIDFKFIICYVAEHLSSVVAIYILNVKPWNSLLTSWDFLRK